MNITQQIKKMMSHLHSLKDNDSVIFDCCDFEITKRELIFSVVIFVFLMIVGFSISEIITEHIEDEKREYNQALQVESEEMFKYAMSTNVGNAFCYGKLEAIDTVSYEDVDGQYLYIRKEKEKYTRHEREVKHEDSDGNTYYTTEVYYTWDVVSSESKHSEKIRFLGIEFDYNKIERPYAHYICTNYYSSYTRYVYYGVAPEHTGTIYTELKNNTISDKTNFYENKSISEVLESFDSSIEIFLFWIVWVIFMGVIIYAFYYVDNTWLN